MGQGSSQPEALDEKSQKVDVTERRNALQQLRAVQQDLEGQYVLIETGVCMYNYWQTHPQETSNQATARSRAGRPNELVEHVPRKSNLSLQASEDWQKQLLEDPKVRRDGR